MSEKILARCQDCDFVAKGENRKEIYLAMIEHHWRKKRNPSPEDLLRFWGTNWGESGHRTFEVSLNPGSAGEEKSIWQVTHGATVVDVERRKVIFEKGESRSDWNE